MCTFVPSHLSWHHEILGSLTHFLALRVFESFFPDSGVSGISSRALVVALVYLESQLLWYSEITLLAVVGGLFPEVDQGRQHARIQDKCPNPCSVFPVFCYVYPSGPIGGIHLDHIKLALTGPLWSFGAQLTAVGPPGLVCWLSLARLLWQQESHTHTPCLVTMKASRGKSGRKGTA